MALATGALIWEDDGQVEITTGTPSEIIDGALSVTADVNDNTNTVRAVVASFVLVVNFAATPDVGGWVDLIARQMDIRGAADADAPDANYIETVLARFVVNDHTSAQTIPIGPLAIPAVKEAQIIQYILRNKTGQTIPADWELWKTNFAVNTV